MTVRENLIPDDMPYGERQAQREALGAAGLPSETGIQAPAIPVPGVADVAAAPEGDPFAGGDLFDQLEPSMPGLGMPAPVDPMQKLAETAQASTNVFVREVINRVLGVQ